MTFDPEEGMFGQFIGGTGQELATSMVDVFTGASSRRRRACPYNDGLGNRQK